jgi:methylthioribose-1-phosphate isomerase
MGAPETLQWVGGTLRLLDQTRLPNELVYLDCHDVDQTYDAIKRLVVRGAPAIGIAAAYGVCLARNANGEFDRDAALLAISHLATSRPTAVNLFWALDRMRNVIETCTLDGESLRERLLIEAKRIHDEDRLMCRQIGEIGARLLEHCECILTHCNAGGLATSTWGTALAPIYYLQERGKRIRVYANETRPLLQGARLTAWELHQAGVPVTVCTDSMAGNLMRTGEINAVIVGADRIAANGDVANKIGTYPLAVLSRYHKIPFYVAAATNTFDLTLSSGDLIPIEQRSASEVAGSVGCGIFSNRVVPDGVPVTNPAFDVTPADLVTAIITQLGVIESPSSTTIANHFAS